MLSCTTTLWQTNVISLLKELENHMQGLKGCFRSIPKLSSALTPRNIDSMLAPLQSSQNKPRQDLVLWEAGFFYLWWTLKGPNWWTFGNNIMRLTIINIWSDSSSVASEICKRKRPLLWRSCARSRQPFLQPDWSQYPTVSNFTNPPVCITRHQLHLRWERWFESGHSWSWLPVSHSWQYWAHKKKTSKN